MRDGFSSSAVYSDPPAYMAVSATAFLAVQAAAPARSGTLQVHIYYVLLILAPAIRTGT